MATNYRYITSIQFVTPSRPNLHLGLCSNAKLPELVAASISDMRQRNF
jgi:hypothetical protein